MVLLRCKKTCPSKWGEKHGHTQETCWCNKSGIFNLFAARPHERREHQWKVKRTPIRCAKVFKAILTSCPQERWEAEWKTDIKTSNITARPQMRQQLGKKEIMQRKKTKSELVQIWWSTYKRYTVHKKQGQEGRKTSRSHVGKHTWCRLMMPGLDWKNPFL